jgi:hypothetical protein
MMYFKDHGDMLVGRAVSRQNDLVRNDDNTEKGIDVNE